MITHDQDSDVVKWGLELFESDPYSNNYNYTSGFLLDGDGGSDGYYYRCGEECFKQDRYDIEGGNVDCDEMIAHALQEELSRLAFDECEDKDVEDFRDSGYSVGWVDANVEDCGSVLDGVEGDNDDGGPSSSCSSPEDKLYGGDEWSYALEISNEYAIDGEVEKRLNQMVPIPHVPRINGEIPSIDEATVDHQRLLDRLQLYNLVEFKVQGDGNCQFRALSDQFYRTPKHHKFVRQEVVNQLKSTPEVYEAYVPMDYADYQEKMSRSGEWGDHVTLQAAADSYGVKIFVITSFKDTCYIEILPNVQRSERVIFLSFWAEVHYNSIYPEGDMLALETRRKKKWRMSRNKQFESSGEYQWQNGDIRT